MALLHFVFNVIPHLALLLEEEEIAARPRKSNPVFIRGSRVPNPFDHRSSCPEHLATNEEIDPSSREHERL